MDGVPSALRSRVALLALSGVLVIPFGLSSLKGLTHILSCDKNVGQPFTLQIPRRGSATLTTSTRVEVDQTALCGGLRADVGARARPDGRVAVVVPITNTSPYGWHGTVQLRLGGTSIPVSIGHIGPRQTRTESVVFDLPSGVHQLGGSLLLGP